MPKSKLIPGYITVTGAAKILQEARSNVHWYITTKALKTYVITGCNIKYLIRADVLKFKKEKAKKK